MSSKKNGNGGREIVRHEWEEGLALSTEAPDDIDVQLDEEGRPIGDTADAPLGGQVLPRFRVIQGTSQNVPFGADIGSIVNNDTGQVLWPLESDEVGSKEYKAALEGKSSNPILDAIVQPVKSLIDRGLAPLPVVPVAYFWERVCFGTPNLEQYFGGPGQGSGLQCRSLPNNYTVVPGFTSPVNDGVKDCRQCDLYDPTDFLSVGEEDDEQRIPSPCPLNHVFVLQPLRAPLGEMACMTFVRTSAREGGRLKNTLSRPVPLAGGLKKVELYQRLVVVWTEVIEREGRKWAQPFARVVRWPTRPPQVTRDFCAQEAALLHKQIRELKVVSGIDETDVPEANDGADDDDPFGE